MRRHVKLPLLIAAPAGVLALASLTAFGLGQGLLAMAGAMAICVYLTAVLGLVLGQVRLSHASLRAQIRAIAKQGTRRHRTLRDTTRASARSTDASLSRISRESARIGEALERLEFTIGGLQRSHRSRSPDPEERENLANTVAREVSARAWLETTAAMEHTPGFGGPTATSVAGAVMELQHSPPESLLLVGLGEQSAWFASIFEAAEVATVDPRSASDLRLPELPGSYTSWYDLQGVSGPFDTVVVHSPTDPYPALPLIEPLIPNGRLLVTGHVSETVRRTWSATSGRIASIHSMEGLTIVELEG